MIENFVATLSRQNLDDIEMLKDMPIAQDRLETYLDRMFERTQKVSSVIRQSLTSFEKDGATHISWNELGFKSKDILQLLGVPLELHTFEGTQGFQGAPSKVSLAILGLCCCFMHHNIRAVSMRSFEDHLQWQFDIDVPHDLFTKEGEEFEEAFFALIAELGFEFQIDGQFVNFKAKA